MSRDMSSEFADVVLTMPVPADLPPDSPSDDDAHDDGPARPAFVRDSYFRNTLAFVFLFYNMTLNLFVLAVVHERVPSQIQQPLPDIAFDLLPKADWTLSIAEYVIVMQVTAVLILIFLHRYRLVAFFPLRSSHLCDHRTVVFRRLCLIMGVLYLFRAVCMISTVMPRANHNYYCSPQVCSLLRYA